MADNFLNVLNPQGQLVSFPQEAFDQDAIQQGYKIATPEQINAFQEQQQFTTPSEKLKAFAEGALRGGTFGLGAKLETGLGVPPENIQKREEYNPYTSQAGEIAGLVGTSLVPGGEGALIGKIGEAGAEALGGTKALTRVGSAAVKGAIETGLVQSGDEVSKMFSQDPNQTAETAMLNVGLSSLMGAGIGGAFGAVSPLWKATTGSKLGDFLGFLQKRANGEPAAIPHTIEESIQHSGLEVPPEIRSSLSDEPELQNQFQKLQESTTTPGLKAQQTLRDFREEAQNAVLRALGSSAESLPSLEDISANKIGSELQDSLAKNLNLRTEPFKEFNDIKNKFSNVELDEITKSKIADEIAQKAQAEGHMISPSSPQAGLINTALKELSGLKTLEDLRLYQSNLWGRAPYGSDLFRPASMMNKVLRQNEMNVLESAVGKKAPELADKLQLLRTAYGEHSDLMDQLNSRLHVGKYAGPESFVTALKEMKPEDVLNRLTRPNDAGMIDLIQKEFPEVADKIKSNTLNKILANASHKAPQGQSISLKTLYNSLDKMTPEMRAFALPPGAEQKVSAIRTILDAIPQRINPSGTAKTLDSLWNKVPGSATAMASMLLGHNPAIGFALGQIGKWVSRDAPDAIRLAMLKFLGHSGPVDPAAFKSAVEYAVATIKGETLLTKSVKNLVRGATEVLPRNELPKDKDIDRLDKKLQDLNANQAPLLNTGDKTAYYLPEHNGGISGVAARATQYLNQLRPSTDKLGILDEPRKPSQGELTAYNRALSIAQQPLLTLDHIQKGTLTNQDMATLRAIYPNLYARMSQKIYNEVTEQISKKETIPYKLRIGLSQFLGQPLDSSMTPQAILSNQMAMQPPQMPQQAAPKQRGSKQALSKLPGTFMTPNDARAAQKTARA